MTRIILRPFCPLKSVISSVIVNSILINKGTFCNKCPPKRCNFIMAGETVIYKNDLNLVPLRRFTSTEIDLFFVMCNKLKEQNTRKLQIDFKELKHLSNYYHRSLDRFTQDLEQVYDKMLMLTYSQRSGKNFEKFVLFTSYKVNVDEQFLEIAINTDLKHILNSITGDFTKFELEVR